MRRFLLGGSFFLSSSLIPILSLKKGKGISTHRFRKLLAGERIEVRGGPIEYTVTSGLSQTPVANPTECDLCGAVQKNPYQS
jgi:hypothetical protein